MNEKPQSGDPELESSRNELARPHSDLAGLFESMRLPAILLDDELLVRGFTPSAAALYGLELSDLGRPFAHITERVEHMPPLDLEGARSGAGEDVEIHTRDGRWFSRRVLPYRNREGRPGGHVLTFTDVTALKQSEQDWRLAAIVESSQDAIIGKALDGTIMSWNRGATRLYGYEPEEVLGRSIHLLVPEEDRAALHEMLSKVLRGERVEHFETVRLCKDGRRMEVSLDISPIEDREGRIVGASATSRDITQRKEAERRLLEQEQRLRLITDSLPVLVSYVGPDQRYVHVNAAYHAWFGTRPEDVVGRTVRELLGDAAYELIREDIERVLQGEPRSWERRIPYKRGPERVVHAEYVPHFAPNGRVAGFYGLVSDVTERARQQEAVRESEERFRRMADAAPVLIWLSGPDKTRTWCNRPWLEFTGRSMEQELGYGWAEGVHPEDLERCIAIYERSFDAREPFAMEYRLLRHDGEYRWLLDHGSPQYVGDEFIGYVDSCTDVTEYRRTEEALREADRRKDEFLAVLGHELRNPLAALSSGIRILQESTSEADLDWTRNMMAQQMEQLVSLINDLLDLSRISRGKIDLRLRRCSLASIVERAVESARPLIEKRRHELTISIEPADLALDVDPTRLEQVLVNLLTNAAKYTPLSGHLQLRGEVDGEEVRISVRDDGVGLRPDSLETIFEPFAQVRSGGTRDQGLGIGLSVVRQIVELHGGRVHAASEGPGRGSTFTVRLTRQSGREMLPEEPPEREPELPRLSRPLLVLVVDDNMDAAEGLARLLAEAGCQVRAVHSGAMALDAVRRRTPEVVLLDIGLPDIDGYRVAEEMKRNPALADTVLIALTGFGDEEARARIEACGFDHHLLKPVDLAALLRIFAGIAGDGPSET